MPQKSVLRVLERMGALGGSTYNDPKSLKFHAYCVKVAQELKIPDTRKHHQYCARFLDFIRNNVSTLDKTFFMDKAQFH